MTACALASCSADPVATSAESIATVDTYEATQCANEVRCGKVSADFCSHRFAVESYAYARALDRGAVLFDQRSMDACFSEPCTRGRVVWSAACRSVFVGTLAEGEICHKDFECAVGGCVGLGPEPTGRCAVGTAALGAACARATDCAPVVDELVGCVVGAEGERRCRRVIDAPSVGEGAQCSPVVVDAVTAAIAPCGEGTFCVSGSPSSCASVPARAGIRCDDLGLDACEAGLACTRAGCGPALNQPLLGGACDELSRDAPVMCDRARGLYCRAGTCQFPPDEIGVPCAEGCGGGLTCGGVGVCVAPGEIGAGCTFDGDCTSSFCNRRGFPPVCGEPS